MAFEIKSKSLVLRWRLKSDQTHKHNPASRWYVLKMRTSSDGGDGGIALMLLACIHLHCRTRVSPCDPERASLAINGYASSNFSSEQPHDESPPSNWSRHPNLWKFATRNDQNGARDDESSLALSLPNRELLF